MTFQQDKADYEAKSQVLLSQLRTARHFYITELFLSGQMMTQYMFAEGNQSIFITGIFTYLSY